MAPRLRYEIYSWKWLRVQLQRPLDFLNKELTGLKTSSLKASLDTRPVKFVEIFPEIIQSGHRLENICQGGIYK
jgi:hypothetical protein